MAKFIMIKISAQRAYSKNSRSNQYGSQACTRTKLKRQRHKVAVGLRKGKSFDKAKEDGFDVRTVGEAVKDADVTMVPLPDEGQQKYMKQKSKII